ncbi:protein spire-like [Hyalella azteca]|uniref:Protein spire-like n=1 Tax=Hyalella azteca TaxID=294128 RepID=A0A8B7P093_HYAAZ|nr:protein spire-like [Hyalella azteca]
MGDTAARSILDHRGCVDLETILVKFGAPISEERAWAICYSAVKCYLELDSQDKSQSAIVTSLQDLILHKDGFVHRDTFLAPAGSIALDGATCTVKRRERQAPESKLVAELGWVLYSALDYGLGHAEERDLSPPLHSLVEQMISADNEPEADDEGIERDLGRTFTLTDIVHECEKRLLPQFSSSSISGAASKKFSSTSPSSVPTQSSSKTSPTRTSASPTDKRECVPSDHYRAVMRAFVTEAQDLQLFLATVAEGSSYLSLTSDLLSSQHDLDQLQHHDWAVLWKQVMLQLREGVKLKKVNYSKTPLEYTLTPYEMLMEDIRSRRYTLNKVMVNGDMPQRVKKDAHSIILDFIRSRPPLKKASERRLAPRSRQSTPMETLMQSIRQEHSLRHVQTPARPQSVVLGRVTSEGAPSLPKRKLISFPSITIDAEDDDDDDLSDIAPASPPQSSLFLGGSAPPTMQRGTSQCNPLAPSSAAPTPSQSNAHFASHLDCLSLTLEEVVHIRNVLTKADLEALPLDLTIKEDMAKGKICFLCMKVRFSFFGYWAVECRLCKRNVCKKCVSKMRIPAEHFGNIPVLMLSPQAFSPREEEEESQTQFFPRQLFSRLQELPKTSQDRRVSSSCSVGSAPSSPSPSPRSGAPHSHK